MKHTRKLTLRCLCEGAILVALAQILGYLKLFHLPQGGSISLGMLPIFLFCARWGFGPGMIASLAFSLLQLFGDAAYAVGWQSILGDYIVAYTVIGFAGLFHKANYGFCYGAALGGILRYIITVITGATLWGEYMPDAFWGITMTNPWIYSLLYNITIVISTALCIIVGVILYRPMGKYLRGEDLAK